MSGRASYDPVASLYDRYWGLPFSAFATEALRLHLLPHLSAPASVLDLCCGTGLVLAHMEELGFQTAGVDESAEMLAAARRNAPRAHLQQADMAEFTSDYRFDAAVSFYNSLNHARSLQHLRNTIENVGKHLQPGAYFLFDYVLPEGFETTWEWREQIDGWTFDYTYDESSGQATCRINRKDAICQTSFQPEQLHQALHDAGLALVYEAPMAGAMPRGLRSLVLARKTVSCR